MEIQAKHEDSTSLILLYNLCVLAALKTLGTAIKGVAKSASMEACKKEQDCLPARPMAAALPGRCRLVASPPSPRLQTEPCLLLFSEVQQLPQELGKEPAGERCWWLIFQEHYLASLPCTALSIAGIGSILWPCFPILPERLPWLDSEVGHGWTCLSGLKQGMTRQGTGTQQAQA